MFVPKEGSWYIHSDIDPRWNASGRCYLLFSVGMPSEVQTKLEELKKLYGEPPVDLEWGGMKD